MKGFKSFGSRTELVFGDRYNVVLGPNGSGKSNIMDALCFVLGKGSAKGMRAEKAANLIYNGGKSKNPSKQGEVHIYFDNLKKIFPTEEDEVKITRIIKSTGQSVYKINDKRRTRQQILDLLGIANIDPNGYNIILQGDIVRFVEMSPNNRREVIEEIAGIGLYEEKKNKAMTELNKVDQKLNEADIILTERKTYLKELKKDRDTAMKYKELDDKLARNKATQLHLQIKQKKDVVEKHEIQIKTSQEEINKLQQKIDVMKKEAVEKKEEAKSLTRQVEEKGEKEQVAMMKRLEQQGVEIATHKTRIISCKNEIERVNTRKDQLSSSLKELNDKISELENQQKESERGKQSTLKLIQEVEQKLDKFRKKNKLDGAEDIDKEIAEVDNECEEKEKEIQAIREEQQNLLREKDKLELLIDSMDEKISKVLELEKGHKSEIEALKQKQQEFKKATVELNTILNEDSSLALQLSNIKDKLNRSRDELSALESKNAGLKESIGMNLAVTKILEQKNKLGQIYGMVSQLGQVESKSSLALEITAGPKIKSIVVDTDQTAAKCIKYLKDNKLGIATFLPLNKIKPVREHDVSGFLKVNGVVGKAIDLISYEPKFKNVFSYVFGNTLVVNNIDVARRVGVGNVKMVTLEGDFAEVSGAMHGGFRQKKRSMQFQEKEVVTRIKSLEGDVAESERLKQVLETRKNDNEDKIAKLREFKANLEGDIIKTEKSLHIDSDDLTATKKRKKELQAELDEADKNITSVGLKVSAINKDLATLKIKKHGMRDKIMQLRNPRLVAELNTFEQKREQLKEELTKQDSNIKNYTLQVKNILLPEKENTLKIIKQHDKEIVTFNTEVLDLNKKITVAEKDLKEKEKLQKEFYAQFRELFTRRDKLNADIQTVETKIITSEEKIRSKEQKMNIHSVENARVKGELSGLVEEFSKYKDVELFSSKPIEQIKKDIWEFERMTQSIGNVNMRALEIYDSVEKEYNNLLEKKETLIKEKDEVMLMINEIETKKKELFMKSFEVINSNFQNLFGQLTTKGEAFLDVENIDDPLSEGVGIKVRLVGKKFLDIRSLSGGEKTLTAMAFIFSIQEHQPASFYIFDEIDAALDKKNSEKLSQLVSTYADRAQYIIISHNDGVISEADTLYGVTMDKHNISKVVSLKI
ncbi:chromosome segregation protein SMC [Candidatus Woesearchaeota archaeon]|nr:chromosome segregation protein SMC [Candidatus Woesearchaeota archaeon]MBT5272800.1 chromosome segregation protein SMC [Candidatus Woesearchaeota archaeon]MBT6040412.1 chromosome segregation protein SMC [Candidatus Woesearchaeota archaeon]MBT6336955.1 chromosome segregation protein SMC [Candidatus Woesearchaeota archaeon]MBT7926841.1 chromosome segregation protein SMC [Candidatus Woesearchaeota archaeon]